MAKKKADEAAARPAVELLTPMPAAGIIWPFHGGSLRGYTGLVVRADDPLLDTSAIDPQVVREFGLIPGCRQRDRLMAAPKGAVVTPHDNAHAARLYARLGYDGAPYASKDPQPAPTEPSPVLRSEPEEQLEGSDLEVPERDDQPPVT